MQLKTVQIDKPDDSNFILGQIEPEGVENKSQLSGWIQRAVKFVGHLPAKEK
jgi:hypothetical protein